MQVGLSLLVFTFWHINKNEQLHTYFYILPYKGAMLALIEGKQIIPNLF